MLKFMCKNKQYFTREIFIYQNLWGLIRIPGLFDTSDGVPVFIFLFIYFYLFIFVEKVDFKNSTDDKKHRKLSSMQKNN